MCFEPNTNILNLEFSGDWKQASVTIVAFLAPRSRGAAELAQLDAAAAMTEPNAALGGCSRVSRLQTALFQRLVGCCPNVNSVAVPPFAT